ncbi:MAG: ATP-binding cassette domain-containing protein [Chthoniobacterales bacterium]
MKPEIVTIEDLSKTFKGMERPALDTVTCGIREGAITGLVGPDGAGKTTLMRLIAGLMEPASGSVKVLGLDPIKDVSALREVTGYMPQKFGLYEDLTVFENLTLHADLRNVIGEERKKVFTQLLTFTDLTKFTTRFAGKLSGGMKQKLGLACALLGSPKLLLLDEPSVGVDPISRRELWQMVGELAGGGMAVVWSTSYLDEAERCDATLLLNEGKLLFAGKPSELTDQVANRVLLLRNPEGSRRRVLSHALNEPEVLDGVIQGDSIRLVLRDQNKRPNLTKIGAGEKAELVPVKPRFEDAFMNLLGGGPGGTSVLAGHLDPIPHDGSVVIEADNLTKQFGDFVATDKVTFQVQRGEIYGLLGPNGAGKSTTFKMMCGLLTPTSGKAMVVGIDLKKSASKARQRIGYMAQKFSLYGNLTVEQNLLFFSGVYGIEGATQRDTVKEMVDIFHLTPFLKMKTDTLSLGYKQRLALACAIMHEPDILFLDEPTSGVDPVTRREFWTHINAVVEKGVTVMVTTHFMDEAEYCDRIGLVFRGQLIASGTPDDLKKSVVSKDLPDPTMEDAFIELVTKNAHE